MTGGNSPICYLKAYHTNLYLSADAEKVQEAIDEGESSWRRRVWGIWQRGVWGASVRDGQPGPKALSRR